MEAMDKDFLDVFWDLSEIQDEKRIDGAVSLINLLKTKQKDHRIGNEESFDELSYTCKRLVRGMASDRKGARLGFCIALIEVLKEFDGVTVDGVLELANEYLSPSDKQEVKNAIIGQALVVFALVRSRRELSPGQIAKLTKKMYNFSKKNVYLEPFCCSVIEEIFNKVTKNEFKSLLFPLFKNQLHCGWNEENSTVDLWLLLVCKRRFPNVITEKFLKKHWHQKQLISPETFGYLAQIMMVSTSAHPRIHPVCSEIVKCALKSNNFELFWNTVVDDKLMKHEKEKTYLAFELLKYIIPLLKTDDQVSCVLSPNLIRNFIQKLSHSNLVLHEAAKLLADFLISFVAKCENSSIQFMILKKLLTRPGTILFDRITKTTTVASILIGFSSDAIKKYTDFLMNCVTGSNLDNSIDSNINDQRGAAAQQLEILLKMKTLRMKNWEWSKQVIQFFAIHSFFVVKSIDSPVLEEFSVPATITPELRTQLKICLFRSLARITTWAFSRNNPQSKELFNLYYSIIMFCNSLLKVPKLVVPATPLSKKAMSHWKETLNLVKEMRKDLKEEEAALTENSFFQMFFMQLLLQMLDAYKEIIPLIKELKVCFEKAVKERSGEDEESDGEDEPSWVETVIEIILSFISENEHERFMPIIKSIFHLLCPYLSVKSVQPILEAITPQVEEEEDDESDLEDYEGTGKIIIRPDGTKEVILATEEESNASDEEKDEESKLSEEESGSSDEESSSSDEESEAGDEKTHFTSLKRAELEAALEPGSGSEESDDVNLDDVDEAELERVDAALTQVFKSRKLTVEEELIQNNFRIRCLGLLEVIVTIHPTIPVLTSMIVPLVELMHEVANKDKNDVILKIRALLFKLMKTKQFKAVGDRSEDPGFFGIWHRLINLAETVRDLHVADHLTNSCSFLIRCMMKWSESDAAVQKSVREGIVEEYKKLTERFLVDRTFHISRKILSSFYFHSRFAGDGDLPSHLLHIAIKDNVRVFHKIIAFQFLNGILERRKEILDLWDEEKLDSFNLVFLKTIKKFIKVMGKDMKSNFADYLLTTYTQFCSYYKRRVNKPYKAITIGLLEPILHIIPKKTKLSLQKLFPTFEIIAPKTKQDVITKKSKAAELEEGMSKKKLKKLKKMKKIGKGGGEEKQSRDSAVIEAVVEKPPAKRNGEKARECLEENCEADVPQKKAKKKVRISQVSEVEESIEKPDKTPVVEERAAKEPAKRLQKKEKTPKLKDIAAARESSVEDEKVEFPKFSSEERRLQKTKRKEHKLKLKAKAAEAKSVEALKNSQLQVESALILNGEIPVELDGSEKAEEKESAKEETRKKNDEFAIEQRSASSKKLNQDTVEQLDVEESVVEEVRATPKKCSNDLMETRGIEGFAKMQRGTSNKKLKKESFEQLDAEESVAEEVRMTVKKCSNDLMETEELTAEQRSASNKKLKKRETVVEKFAQEESSVEANDPMDSEGTEKHQTSSSEKKSKQLQTELNSGTAAADVVTELREERDSIQNGNNESGEPESEVDRPKHILSLKRKVSESSPDVSEKEMRNKRRKLSQGGMWVMHVRKDFDSSIAEQSNDVDSSPDELVIEAATPKSSCKRISSAKKSAQRMHVGSVKKLRRQSESSSASIEISDSKDDPALLQKPLKRRLNDELFEAEKEFYQKDSLQMEFSPKPSPQREISPKSNPQKEISPKSNPQKEISPKSNPQKVISPKSSPQNEISPKSSLQKEISPKSSLHNEIFPKSSSQKEFSLDRSSQKKFSLSLSTENSPGDDLTLRLETTNNSLDSNLLETPHNLRSPGSPKANGKIPSSQKSQRKSFSNKETEKDSFKSPNVSLTIAEQFYGTASFLEPSERAEASVILASDSEDSQTSSQKRSGKKTRCHQSKTDENSPFSKVLQFSEDEPDSPSRVTVIPESSQEPFSPMTRTIILECSTRKCVGLAPPQSTSPSKEPVPAAQELFSHVQGTANSELSPEKSPRHTPSLSASPSKESLVDKSKSPPTVGLSEFPNPEGAAIEISEKKLKSPEKKSKVPTRKRLKEHEKLLADSIEIMPTRRRRMSENSQKLSPTGSVSSQNGSQGRTPRKSQVIKQEEFNILSPLNEETVMDPVLETPTAKGAEKKVPSTVKRRPLQKELASCETTRRSSRIQMKITDYRRK